MSSPQDKIDSLEAEIEGYRIELSVATTKKERSELRKLMTVRSETLNTLLIQPQQQQQQQQGGKFYSVLVCGVGLSSCYNLVY